MNTLLPNFERICAVANTFLFIGIDRELADTDRRLGTSPNNVTEPVSKRPFKAPREIRRFMALQKRQPSPPRFESWIPLARQVVRTSLRLGWKDVFTIYTYP